MNFPDGTIVHLFCMFFAQRLFPSLRRPAAVTIVLLCAAFFSLRLFAQSPSSSELAPQDPAALVRRAVANHFAEEAAHKPLRFALHRKDERHDITREVIETSQGDVAMVVADHGAPLSPTDRQAQIARLDNLAAHPDLQAHRQKREQEDNARVDKLMRLLPDAFLYRYIDTAPCIVTRVPDIPLPGTSAPPPATASPADTCYHMSFKPNPHWDPPDTEAKILRGMAGDIWMEKSHERLYRLDAHLIADVEFGWGIVGRLNRGGTIYLEQTQLSSGEWQLTRMKLNLAGKLLMFKSITVQLNEEIGRFFPVPPHLDYRTAIRMLKDSRAGALASK